MVSDLQNVRRQRLAGHEQLTLYLRFDIAREQDMRISECGADNGTDVVRLRIIHAGLRRENVERHIADGKAFASDCLDHIGARAFYRVKKSVK